MNRIGAVHPVIKQGAEEVIRQAYKEGIYVQFSDGYRSHASQNALYAQGRTKPGPIVTNARGGQSLHNFGLALDMFISNKDGTSASWPESTLRKVAQIAKGIGFEWGGDWKGFMDNPHIQMTGGLTLAQLQAGVKPKIDLKSGGSVTKPSTKPNTPSEPKNPVTKAKKPNYTTKSIVTFLQSINQPYSYNHRKKIAGYYGIKAYQGTAVQNLILMDKLQKDYKKNDKLRTSKPVSKKSVKTPLPTSVLRYGDKGEDVKRLQRALNKANFKVGTVDGIYGVKTKDAVERFQKVHDAYNVDGVYGPRTQKRLNKLVN